MAPTNIYISLYGKEIGTISLTSIVDMKLVDDSLVAAAKDDHKVLDCDGSVAMSRLWTGPGGPGNFFPLQDGRRHCYGRLIYATTTADWGVKLSPVDNS